MQGPPRLLLSAQSLPVYLPASCCACACLAAVEVRQGRRPLLLGLRRRPRPVGASSAAAAPCALSHRQTPPLGPQGSSLRHEVPSRVYPNTREAMPALATAPGSRRRPIPDGAPSVAAAPLPLPSVPLVRGDTTPRPSARGADPRGRPAAAAAMSPHRPARRVRGGGPPLQLPSAPLVRGDTTRGRPRRALISVAVTRPRCGDIPARPSAQGDDSHGRPAASAVTSPRGRSRGVLISAAADLRPPSPPRRSFVATHPCGHPRGALIPRPSQGHRSDVPPTWR